MKNKHQFKSGRRKVVATVLLGTTGSLVIPEKWTQPVIDSVVLPGHAQTTGNTPQSLGCDGVFCELSFNNTGIIGAAQVISGILTFSGDSEGGTWSGSGAVAADGSYSVPVVFTGSGPAQVNGFVTEDCLRISGAFDFPEGPVDPITFTAPITMGAVTISDCDAM